MTKKFFISSLLIVPSLVPVMLSFASSSGASFISGKSSSGFILSDFKEKYQENERPFQDKKVKMKPD
ncbi:hypothetical protein [Bacillus sp. 2205SS5-2]|uniref:hypothetical protein n=1 Tax=Bacillus sp. 2205SS5-2 TaxID=3109031 RepID=UPI003005E06F